MKSTGKLRNRSRFWSRLLGVLITFVIVALLAFGAVQSMMGELADAYDALTASEVKAAYLKTNLDNTRTALAETQAERDYALAANEQQAVKLQMAGRALVDANAKIEALNADRNDLKRGLREAAQILAQTDQSYKAAVADYRAAKAELEHIKQQPKISVVMTTERQFAMSQRERFAAAQTQMLAAGDGGMVYFASASAFHEKEQHLRYSERSQVVLTQTGPGDDVLRCLRDGCAMILAAQQSQLQMQSYAYQAQSFSSEMLMVDGRRGRR